MSRGRCEPVEDPLAMTIQCNVATYVINLARATERMQHMRTQLNGLSVPFTRIEAVLGKELNLPIPEFDEKKFNILTGKQANPGEIGCYLSHIQTLRTFLDSEASYALVLEDDVNLPENLMQILASACTHGSHWDLLRLTSSREGAFLPIASLVEPYQLGYNTRVLKNTGAYFINRNAAELIIKHLLPMRLPYDVALDREWDCGFKTACIYPFPIKLEPFEGQINKAPRIRLFRATTFHLFHLYSRLQRKKHRKGYHKALTCSDGAALTAGR